MIDTASPQPQQLWDAFLKEWPIERLRSMRLEEYTAVGQDHTFTAWIERRLDTLGSIWGGSSFKFGIFSRRDKTAKASGNGDSYTDKYGWYSKYGATPEDAFAKVKAAVLNVAEASARGDYASIDSVDLGDSYKWKIAFHYQDRTNPGIIAVFKPSRLKAWLKGRVGTIPDEPSQLHRQILALEPTMDLMKLSEDVWRETAPPDVDVDPPLAGGDTPPQSAEASPLNLVLYGPPGTGKTFVTSELAVRICDGVIPDGRAALMARYRELKNLRRIRFVTFHPSFSYEEFVEGIRPTAEAGNVRYDVRAGIFKQIVGDARRLLESSEAPRGGAGLKGRKLFKMSLGDSTNTKDDWIFPDCLENGYVCHGFASGIDFSSRDTVQAVREEYKSARPTAGDDDFAVAAVNRLKNEIKQGDLILISDGNTHFRALAEVTGPYQYQHREAGYDHRRPVKWLWKSESSVPVDIVLTKRLSQMTIYLIDQSAIKWQALQELVAPKRTTGEAPNCVLIIDEINRANLAKTFGELITLLEPSKRIGQADEQEAELPYSGDRLSVPPNLYVIGTMNTADRSIALMDTALRRRFSFREMAPRPDLLSDDVEGTNLQALLVAINARVEALFDRDHVIGHTYLMGVSSFEDLSARFLGQIVPLLQEYFFEDWKRIQQVMNDEGQPPDMQVIQAVEDASGPAGARASRRFRVNPSLSPAAVRKIYA